MSGSRVFLLVLSVAGTISMLAAVAAADPGSGNGAIAFSSDGRLYTVDPGDGSETDFGPGTMPSWSPDGSKLAFLGDGGTSVMNADGSGRRLLHRGDDRRAVWSPDGTRLAFVTQSLPGNGALVVSDVASGNSTMAVAAGVQLTWSPSWAPDGTELAYTEGSALDVVAVHPDGSGRRIVAGGIGVDEAPAWSPDGTQIAFLHGSRGEFPTLHVVPSAGGTPRRLTDTESRFVYEPPPAPAWSPDGTRIAFTGTQVVGYTRYGLILSSAVHVVDADGTLEHRLTRAGATPGFDAPTWSPDGHRILFEGNGVYFMNPDGTCEMPVGERRGESPSWRPVAAPPAPYLRCADLEVTASHHRSAVAVGGAEEFRIAVKNLENQPATGVRLEAGAPEHGSFEVASADQGSCTIDGGSLSCQLGGLQVGESVLVTVGVRTSGIGLVSALARVSGNEPDGNRGNNVAALSVEALQCGLVATDEGGRLVGTFGPDVICGRAGEDVIFGLGGNDSIDAGPRADRVYPGPGRDLLWLRAGADFADARDGRRDTIVCGGERDLVLVDRLDRTSKDCEHVERPRIHRCKTIGTVRSDELVGTELSDEICALSGNDDIHTLAGNDAVDAGSGNDTIDGGKGRDVLIAGEGYDTIFSRDGARDRIRCGPQDDLVFADKRDVVARDCERVHRRWRRAPRHR
jgi:Tol biopolymer transport system component